MEKFIKCLKILYKILPYIISALAGSGATLLAGCKIGSLVSLAPIV